jgi:hypothetical protein
MKEKLLCELCLISPNTLDVKIPHRPLFDSQSTYRQSLPYQLRADSRKVLVTGSLGALVTGPPPSAQFRRSSIL